MAQKWYEIRAKADSAEVWLYDVIGSDMFGEGITAKAFVKELSALKASQIDLHVNSPGGSVFDGQAIYNALARHPASVTTYVDGVAASIAGVVALAGDQVVMAKNALFMVHDPFGMTIGNAKEIRSYADILDKVRDTILTIYEGKTGLPTETIEELMAAETWMNADEALAYGFADSVGAELAVAACTDFSKFNYKHPPTARVADPMVDEDPDPVEHEVIAEPDGEPAKVSDLNYLRLAVGLSPSEHKE